MNPKTERARECLAKAYIESGGSAEIAEAIRQDDQVLIRDDTAIAAMLAFAQEGATASEGEPIPMVLHCPKCGLQHVDEPAEGWDNPPHRSHLCHGCGCIWRPADVPTNGVESVATVGKADNWDTSATPSPDPAALVEREGSLAEAIANPALAISRLNRDELGRMVRKAWVRWAEKQPAPKPSWLLPYDDLAEPDKEVDRQIGVDLARIGATAWVASQRFNLAARGSDVPRTGGGEGAK